MSTNKVYGDVPNEPPLVEKEARYDCAGPKDFDAGIPALLSRTKSSLIAQ